MPTQLDIFGASSAAEDVVVRGWMQQPHRGLIGSAPLDCLGEVAEPAAEIPARQLVLPNLDSTAEAA